MVLTQKSGLKICLEVIWLSLAYFNIPMKIYLNWSFYHTTNSKIVKFSNYGPRREENCKIPYTDILQIKIMPWLPVEILVWFRWQWEQKSDGWKGVGNCDVKSILKIILYRCPFTLCHRSNLGEKAAIIYQRGLCLCLNPYYPGEGGAIIILRRKNAISPEPNLRWTSDQSVNSRLSVVFQ